MPDPQDFTSVGPRPHKNESMASFTSKRRVGTEEPPPSRMLSFKSSQRGSTSMGRSGSPKTRPGRPESPISVRRNSVVLTTQTSSAWLTPLGESPKTKKSYGTISAADDPFSERNSNTRLFHNIQNQIRESVERADQTLAEYDLQRPGSAMTEETEEKPLSPLPDDLTEVVPAAERFAMMQLGTLHSDNMSKLVDIYNKFEDFMAGDDEKDVTSEHEVKEMFSELYAHRQAVVTKVEAARDAARAAADALMMPDDEPDTPVEELEADEPKDDAGPPLKEHIRHLESRIHDLQEELEEEHDNYQQMEDAKDQMIKSLRSQLIETQNQMQDLVGKTAHEIADSASQVEDTRLHIAYLTLQLRNAREMAAQRVFDAEKWISREDYEALLREQQALRVQVKKSQDRMVLEQKNTAEAHEYGRKCLRQMHQADERHAAWELRLRETLKERDADLVKLNYETRLLQSRADKMLHDFDEKKKQMKEDAKDEVLKAVQAMEQQRSIFNTKLQEKDFQISQLKGKCDDLRDQMNAKALALKHMAKKKAKVEVDLQVVPVETQTDWTLLHPAGLDGETTKSTQTGDVRGTLWRVARRRLALKALTSLERKIKTMKTLDKALRAWQTDTDAKWEASQEALAAGLAALEARNNTLAQVNEALVSTVERLKRMRDQEPSVEEKRARLTAALGTCMHQLQPVLSGAMTDVGESLRWSVRIATPVDEDGDRPDSGEREHQREGLTEEDAREFQEMLDKLRQAREVASEAIESSNDVLMTIKEALYGEAMHHVNTARVTLEHEINVVARGDLTKHEAVLTAIKTGVSVDERLSTPWMHGSAAGLDVLAGQKAESSALADVISAWNHQRNDWVKERYKLTHDNKELRSEIARLEESVDQLRRSSPTRPGSSEPMGKWDDPSKMKVELEAYKTLGMEVEGPMREVAGGIVRWWERAVGEAAEIAHVPHGEAPSIFGAGVLLLQAACLAVRRAKELEQKPEVTEEGQQVVEGEIQREMGLERAVAEQGVQAEEPRPPSVQHSDKSTAMSRGSSAKSSRVPSVEPAQPSPPPQPASPAPPSAPQPAKPVEAVKNESKIEEEGMPSPAPSSGQGAEMTAQRMALLKIMGRTAARVRGLALMTHHPKVESESEEEPATEEEAAEEEDEQEEAASDKEEAPEVGAQHGAEQSAVSEKSAEGGQPRKEQAQQGAEKKSAEKDKGAAGHSAMTKVGRHKESHSRKKQVKEAKGSGKEASAEAEAETAPAAKQDKRAAAPKKHGAAEEKAKEKAKEAEGKSGEKVERGSSWQEEEKAALVVQRWVREKRGAHIASGEGRGDEQELQELAKLQVEAAAEVEAALAKHLQQRAALEKELRAAKAHALQRLAEHDALKQQLRQAEDSVLALRQELEERPTVAVEVETQPQPHHHHQQQHPVGWAAGLPATPQRLPDIDWEQWEGLDGVEVPVSRASTEATDGAEEAAPTADALVPLAGVQQQRPAFGFLQARGRPETGESEWSESSSPKSKSLAAAWMTDIATDVAQRDASKPRQDAAHQEPMPQPVKVVAVGQGGWGAQLAQMSAQKGQGQGGAVAAVPAAPAPVAAAGALVEAGDEVAAAAVPASPGAPLASAGTPRTQQQGSGRAESRDKSSMPAPQSRGGNAESREMSPAASQAEKESEGGEVQVGRASKTAGEGQGAGEAEDGGGASRESRAESRASVPSSARSSALPPKSKGSTARTSTWGGGQTAPGQTAPGTSDGRWEPRVEVGVGTEESGELLSSDVIVALSPPGTFRGVEREVRVRSGMREEGQQSEEEVAVVADILRRRYAALLRLKDRIIAELKTQVDSGRFEASASALSESYIREVKAREKAQGLEKEVVSLKRELDKKDADLAPLVEKLKTFDMLQETVAAAQKEVAAMGAMTSSMANELVDAREQARFHEVHAQKMQQEVQFMLSAKAELEETIAELSNTLNALPPTPPPAVHRLPSTVAPPQPTQPKEPNRPRRHEKAGLGTGSVASYHTQVSSDGAQIVVVGEEMGPEEEELESVEQLMRRVDEEFGDLQAGRRAMLDLFCTPSAAPKQCKSPVGAQSSRRRLTASGPSPHVPPLPISSLDGPLKPHPPPGSLSQRSRRSHRESSEESGGGRREERAGGSREEADRLPVLFPPSLLPPTVPGPASSRHRTPR